MSPVLQALQVALCHRWFTWEDISTTLDFPLTQQFAEPAVDLGIWEPKLNLSKHIN